MMDEIAAERQKQFDQLNAENAKLREQVAEACMQLGGAWVRCTELRELAQRADRLLTSLFPYIDYSRCTALEVVAAWRVRARELGVEVETSDRVPYVGLKIGAMHPADNASEYYCGRCGCHVTDHDSYCSECGGALHKSATIVTARAPRTP